MKKMVLTGLAVCVAVVVLAGAGLVYAASRVETPKYKVLQKDDAFEIRAYPALRVAEITRSGSRNGAANAAFRPLARYIFAKSREGDKISMTAPVTQHRGGAGWKVRFIMPAAYTLADLPKPDNAEITLRELPAKRRAAIRFSGRAGDDDWARREAQLRTWLSDRGLSPIGGATLAYYNDPFTPGFLRRNEVLFDLD